MSRAFDLGLLTTAMTRTLERNGLPFPREWPEGLTEAYATNVMKVSQWNAFLRKTMAINWHMSGFDMRVKGGSYAISDAYYQFPVALLLALADMMASYLDEKIYK